MFDIYEGEFRCRIIAYESSHGGDAEEYFLINCLSINSIWWTTEQTMLNIIHRKGFPLDHARRIQRESALTTANLVAAQNLLVYLLCSNQISSKIMLEATANFTLVLLKDKMLNWEIKNNFGGDDQGPSDMWQTSRALDLIKSARRHL